VANSQTYAVQMEKVRKQLPVLLSLSQSLNRKFKKRPAETVSSWYAGSGAVLGFRIPVKQYMGGNFRGVNLDGGDLGSGNMPTYQYMTIGYTAVNLSFTLPEVTQEATATSEQATKNVFKDTMDGALKSFAAYEDSLAYGSGNAVLATGIGSGAAPAGTDPVYTLEPNFGPQRLELGQLVEVYNAAGSVKKSVGDVYVTAINPVAKTATLQGTVTAPANDDVIAVAGYSATLAAGTTRYGLYNYNSSTTSGSTLGLSRTTVPELVTPNYTAGAALSPQFGLILNDYRIQRRDETVIGKTMGIAHMAQRQAAFSTGDSIAEWQVPGPQIAENLDRVPRNIKEASTFDFAGITYMVGKKQDRSRLDQIVLEDYGRVQLKELDYFSVGGKYLFEDRSSSGTVKAATYFTLVSSENTFCADPGAGGIISSLTIPPGM
jgi:hypothetical protein